MSGLRLAALAILVLLLLATFLRTPQKEVLPGELVIPAFVLMVVVIGVAVVRGDVARPSVGVVEWLMLAFLAWNLLSLVLPHRYEAVLPLMAGAPVDLQRWFLAAILLPFGTYQAARVVAHDQGETCVRWLLGAVVGITAYSAWVSIAQFHAPALAWPSYIVDAPNWPGRANGVFNQPVVNGLTLVVGMVVALFLASRSGIGRWPRIALYTLVAAGTYAVYLTHTRAAVLGLVVAVVLGALLARGWRRGFVTIGVLGIVGLATRGTSQLLSSDRAAGGFGSPTELHDRLNVGATAMQAIAEHPLFGVGVGRFAMYNTYQHTAWSDAIDWSRGQVVIGHQNELAVGADVGLPGLALWLGIVVTVIVLLWRARRTPVGGGLTGDGVVGGGGLATVGLIAFAVMLTNGLTVDLRPIEFATVLPLALVGAAVGVAQRSRPGAPAPDDPDPPEDPDDPGVPRPGSLVGTSTAWEDTR